jgi:CHAT domain-containing protein
MGLQRAFHHAGVQNVVCAMWKVDDAATAALVDIFWRKYWQNGRSAARALREAQLEIYRNPLALQADSSRGGLKFKVVPSESESKPTSPPLYWAGFVFSGVDGRLSP